MKLQKNTTVTVKLSLAEAETLLSKFVEKKTGKKIESLNWNADKAEWTFVLPSESEESEIDAAQKAQ
jgi:hypothetical protein